MKKIIIGVLMVLFLAACNLLSVVSPSKSENNASAGPAGVSKVEVSDGVILLTPGQPYNPVTTSGVINNLVGFVTPTATATVDPASVVLPEGIPLYPGATDLAVPTEEELNFANMNGLSGNFVIFYTTDSNEQVVKFYSEKATNSGWNVTDTQTEPDYDGSITQIWDKDNKFLILQTWQPANGLMKVQISWM